ncbi:methyltransferase-like protein [Phaeosphaeriaceae sp. PMI808]|nr:methyltransferase-like protein [Phaeosphaeriaceae sp. PMI808]
MGTSVYLARFIALFICGIFPLYLALRGSSCLSDIALVLSSLSERAENLHVVLNSPLAGFPVPTSAEVFEASANSTKTVDAIRGRRGTRYPAFPDGLANCINSFEQYPFLAENTIQRKHARYVKQSPTQKLISNKLGYPSHFEKARKGIEVNARLTEQVAQIGRELYNTGLQALEDKEDADFGLVDLAFGHLMRDWSTQGIKERQAVFPPVLEGLEQHFSKNGIGKKVLIPGSGMGRLARYNVTANDMDYGSILVYHMLTNHTTSLHQYTLQPFVTKWAHQANPSSRYSTITVPDYMPNKTVKLVEGDFLEVFPQDAQFDAVVTLFFIDMSDNVIDFLSNIYRLLKPGGLWINLGPLKWYPSSDLHLSAEEVLQLADLLGFNVDHTSRKSIHSVYGEQPDSLLKFTYVTQFWTATKRE